MCIPHSSNFKVLLMSFKTAASIANNKLINLITKYIKYDI
jgi:hypothetical protein